MQTPQSTPPSPPPEDVARSRKRQRSSSTRSDQALEPKRANSEGPAQTNSSTVLAPASEEVDAYMAEQGHTQSASTAEAIPPSSDPDPPRTTGQQRWDLVSNASQEPMVVGQTWFVLSMSWYERFKNASLNITTKLGSVREEDVGPPDASELVNADGEFAVAVMDGVNAVFVPNAAWSKIVEWFGNPPLKVSRKVISRGFTREPVLELHPPRLHFLQLVPSPPPNAGTTLTISSEHGSQSPKLLTISAADNLGRLIYKAASLFKDATAVRPRARVWAIAPPATTLTSADFSTNRLLSEGARLLESSETKTVEDAGVVNGDFLVIEFQQGGQWLVDHTRVTSSDSAAAASSQSTQPAPLFPQQPDFFSLMEKSSDVSRSSETKAKSVLKPSVPIISASAASRPREPGLMGLGNLGNTCFMNSALQCLIHTRELADYFLTGVFQDELNPDNPLGMHGAIAEAFGSLVQRLWSPTATSSALSPREFKSTLGRFAPQFSGYQQHDTQEFLAFLLDGLHEDLNRILKKPYVEKPDWEGGAELELVNLARESWQGYLRRNDSVIVDLFQGQYRSTLICPECQKVSITFDPFMYLTLPLPVDKKWQHKIKYVPWDLSKPHVQVLVEVSGNASFREVRAVLGRWMGVDPNKLLTMETFNHRFYKSLDNAVPVSEMGNNDVIWCYELPCISPQSRAPSQPDSETPFVLPVFLTHGKAASTSRGGYGSVREALFGQPIVLAIDRADAGDAEKVYAAVVERLQQWTVHARDLFTWEGGSHIEEVMISITGLPAVERVAVTEIKENGDVVILPEEGDIVDQKDSIVQEQDADAGMGAPDSEEPRRIGVKKDLFEIRLAPKQAQFGSGLSLLTGTREAWATRVKETQKAVAQGEQAALFQPDDALYLEFEESMEQYFFGEERSSYEDSTWERWETFEHPEIAESRQAALERHSRGITLADCLAEFTKEEQLGEDDLWFCPQCKKHQQATKKFDLWSAPDILVVHLKRFSNSRTMRDKIDALVDFPIEGLDLEGMVQQRAIGRKLRDEGVDVDALGLTHLDEPLLYDLFAVDEHLGGLGGGHYRAYVQHHLNGNWYHFDDSYVTPAKATDSVNANAYLLFYKRRTNQPIGGKSHVKIEEARSQPKASASAPEDSPTSSKFGQLPTPPEDSNSLFRSPLSPSTRFVGPPFRRTISDEEVERRSPSGSDSPPPLDDPEPPSFEDAQQDSLLEQTLDPLHISGERFDFPDPSSTRGSPSSSTGASLDEDEVDACRTPDRRSLDEPISP